MSSVATTPILAVPSGDGRIDAGALDTQIRRIVSQINAIIAALAVVRRETDQSLGDQTVYWRTLAGDCQRGITFIQQAMVNIRQQTGDTAGRMSLPTSPPAGGLFASYQRSNDVNHPGEFNFGPGRLARNENKWELLIPGDPGRTYRIRLRVRAYCGGGFMGLPSELPASLNPFLPDLLYNLYGTPDYPIPPANYPPAIRTPPLVSMYLNVAPDAYKAFREPAARCNPTAVDPGQDLHEWIERPAGITLDNRLAWSRNLPFVSMYPWDAVQAIVTEPDGSTQHFLFNAVLQRAKYNAYPYHPSDQQFQQIDRMVDLVVKGGTTLMVRNTSHDYYNGFQPKSQHPANDDPRFPYNPRYLDSMSFQWDMLSFKPYKQPADALTDEYGVPLTDETGADILVT